jgi:hypothetical protein
MDFTFPSKYSLTFNMISPGRCLGGVYGRHGSCRARIIGLRRESPPDTLWGLRPVRGGQGRPMKTFCRLCEFNCGLDTTVDGEGRLVALRPLLGCWFTAPPPPQCEPWLRRTSPAVPSPPSLSRCMTNQGEGVLEVGFSLSPMSPIVARKSPALGLPWVLGKRTVRLPEPSNRFDTDSDIRAMRVSIRARGGRLVFRRCRRASRRRE